jgi:hypothetical protein
VALRENQHQGELHDPPLVLDFSDEPFEAAVYATARSRGTSLWPVRLMPVHLEEGLMSTRPVDISEGRLRAE